MLESEPKQVSASIEKLRSRGHRLTQCLKLLNYEEADSNDSEAKEAWKTILRKHLAAINSLLEYLKNGIAWSLLDDRKQIFKELFAEISNSLNSYMDYEDEETRRTINDIIFLYKEGANSFRTSFINETYILDVFNKELERFREEETSRIEKNYELDSQDIAFKHPDETERKNHMVLKYTEELFKSHFGSVYHNFGRDIKLLASHIIDAELQDYGKIYDFMRKYVALEIAKEKLKIKNVSAFQNFIFKDNVDIDKVMRKLEELWKDKTISAQKHWFILYKVFRAKKWLTTDTQRRFREQINVALKGISKVTQEDFKAIEPYFKEKDYNEWTMDDAKAPQCCAMYKEIALKLDAEFQDSKYAKPGTTINTKTIVKFR